MSTSYRLGKICSDCGAAICDQNKIGICRRCHCRSFRALPHRQTPETEARRIGALVEANKRRAYLPWCPPAYHAEYRRMVSNRKFKAKEAKRIILDQIAADARRAGNDDSNIIDAVSGSQRLRDAILRLAA